MESELTYKNMSRFKKLIHSLLTLLLISGIAWQCCGLAAAVGTATLTLSPASGGYTVGNDFNVNIHENSGSTGINTVEVDLAYNPSQLQYVSSTPNTSVFSSNMYQHPGSNNGLVCMAMAYLGGSLTGDQTVAIVSFRAISASNTSIMFVSGSNSCASGGTGSAVITQSAAQNIWNGVTTGGSYTLTSAPTGGTTPPSGGTSTPTSTPSLKSTSTPTKATGNTSSVTSQNNTNVPATVTTPTNYLIAIKVVDDNSHTLKGIKVTLDSHLSTVTDSTGIASFINVNSGKHTVKAVVKGKTTTESIVVSSQNPLAVQQFEMRIAGHHTSATTIIIIILIILALLLLIGFGLWRQFSSHFHSSMDDIPKVNITAVVGGDSTNTSTTSSTTDLKIPPAPPLPGGTIIKPIDPVDKSNI